MTTAGGIPVEHYSDVLCIWAYVAQIRMDELEQQFTERVAVHYRYVNVFGDTAHKLAGWQERGGLDGYRAHVREVAARFDHVVLGEEVWRGDIPASSLGAHLWLRACDLVGQECGEPAMMARAAWQMRLAFFADGRNIASRQVQAELAESLSLPQQRVQHFLDSGQAHAALAADLRDAQAEHVTGSPTLVFNEGRQRIYGNVGYRVIEANLRELLERPADQCSWC